MRYPLVLLLTTWVGIGWGTAALAHGAHIQHQMVNSIEIQARYDSGEPMKAAQVTIYAPDNPSEPWLTGTTDTEGRFVFTPDGNQPGNWDVTVRQAGHGGILSIPVATTQATEGAAGSAGAAASEQTGPTTATTKLASQSGELSPVQRWITIAAVIWGFIGTALFFSRGKR